MDSCKGRECASKSETYKNEIEEAFRRPKRHESLRSLATLVEGRPTVLWKEDEEMLVSTEASEPRSKRPRRSKGEGQKARLLSRSSYFSNQLWPLNERWGFLQFINEELKMESLPIRG